MSIRKRFTSSLVLAVSAILVLSGVAVSMVISSAGAEPIGKLSCTPWNVRTGGACQITFRGARDNGYGGRGSITVCFSTTGKGNKVFGVKGKCSETNSKGVAFGSFFAGRCGPATIKAVEQNDKGVAVRVVTVLCH